MNRDIAAGKWKQMRGQLHEWWGRLTDDDLDIIGGKAEKLLGKLQERYGYTRQEAEDEMYRRLREYEKDKEFAGSSR